MACRTRGRRATARRAPRLFATEASSSAAAGRGGVQEKRQKLGGAIEAGLEEGGGLDEPRDGAAKRGACVECVLCENADN